MVAACFSETSHAQDLGGEPGVTPTAIIATMTATPEEFSTPTPVLDHEALATRFAQERIDRVAQAATLVPNRQEALQLVPEVCGRGATGIFVRPVGKSEASPLGSGVTIRKTRWIQHADVPENDRILYTYGITTAWHVAKYLVDHMEYHFSHPYLTLRP